MSDALKSVVQEHGDGGGITVNLICCTQVITNEIVQGVPRKGVALTYAMAMKSDAQGADKPDWPAINQAIIAKWGMKGLEAVKKRAWGIASGKIKP